MKYILAIDLGGTKIAIALVNEQNKVLNKKIESIKKDISQTQLIDLIKKISQQVLFESKIKKKDLKAVGVAAPGPLDSKKGIIFYAPNLPKISNNKSRSYSESGKNFKIVTALKKEFQKPVFLENDAKAAAFGEWKYGAGKGTKNMIYLTISTGIGGGIIINGQLYCGSGQAGEIGHMIIDLNGPKCGCGQKGCLEALASGTAIAKMAKSKIKNKKSKISLIYKLVNGRINQITCKIVFEAARKGDKLAKKIIRDSLVFLATGLVNLIHIFQPEKIVLGGGVMKSKDLILPVLRKIIAKKLMIGFKRKVKIVAAKLKDNSGLIGLKLLIQ